MRSAIAIRDLIIGNNNCKIMKGEFVGYVIHEEINGFLHKKEMIVQLPKEIIGWESEQYEYDHYGIPKGLNCWWLNNEYVMLTLPLMETE